MIKTYLGAGVHSCCREEGERQHISSGLPVPGTGPSWKGRNWATIQPLCSLASSGLSPCHSTSRISPTGDHSAKGLPGCSSAPVKCASPHSCHTTLQIVQFSCRHISLLHLCYCRRVRGEKPGGRVVCQLSSEIYFFSMLTWMLSTSSTNLRTQQIKKKTLWLFWCHQQYRGDIASSRKMSLPI